MMDNVIPGWILYPGTFLGLALLGAIWWWLPKWQLHRFHADISDPAQRADAEDKFRRTIAQTLGGLAVLSGLAMSFVEIQTSRDAIQAQGEALLHQRLSQQFTKGIELLGKNRPAETMGGIYALEQVAQQSPDYHWLVMEALTSYVRLASKKEGEYAAKPITADVQTILIVIGRRNAKHDGGRTLNLNSTRLRKANMLRANFRRVDLRDADLTEADLRYADLTEANLSGAILDRTKLQHARLSGAFGLTQAQLDAACGNDYTKLPDNLKIKPCERMGSEN